MVDSKITLRLHAHSLYHVQEPFEFKKKPHEENNDIEAIFHLE